MQIKDVECRSDENTLTIFVSLFSKKVYYFTSLKINYVPLVLVRNDQLTKALEKFLNPLRSVVNSFTQFILVGALPGADI